MNKIHPCPARFLAPLVLSAVMASAPAFAFEDEPDELNWDRLGGTLTGFGHFRAYCDAHPEFRARLLAKPRVDELGSQQETVWLTPDAFANAAVRQWSSSSMWDEPCISAPAGHRTDMVRIPVDIPADGWYRVWTRTFHFQGCAASFELSLEDGRLADVPDGTLRVVQDAWSFRFDASEHARRQNPLPDYRNEPNGYRWEASPMVRLAKGRRALVLRSVIHGGPFAPRYVSAVVLTRDPLAVPERPAGDGAVLTATRQTPGDVDALRGIWERRPMCRGENVSALRPLWREWRTAFFADLAAGNVAGVEAGRLAGMAAYDEASNLVGTPAQIAAERAAMADFLSRTDRTHFKVKFEAEDFESADGGWWIENNANASGGRQLIASYGVGQADAVGEGEVPTNGTYAVWVRYYEVRGYLAEYSCFVEDANGTVRAERVLAADAAYNLEHGGHNWVRIDAPLSAGRFRVRLHKEKKADTYRRVDAVIVTDDFAWTPDGTGEVIPPLDQTRPLTVWRPRAPWIGFSRLSYPQPGQDLSAYRFDLRKGEVESVLLLVRNNTEGTMDATPRISGDKFGLVSWRVPGFVLSDEHGWQPMPLFRREELLVPPGETHGVWLTVDGRRAFSSDRIDVLIGAETFTLDVVKKFALPARTPVPYVYGWATPHPTVSCWELFRDIGINVVSDDDCLVPKSEAAKYGVRLTVRLNDGDVGESHVRYLNERFSGHGYSKGDWAWSFADEPNNNTADSWTNLAAQVRRLDPTMRIWVNPGEYESSGPEACLKITPYANIYCPYINHYTSNGGGNPVYNGQLRRVGSNFDLLLGYTTPCFSEKAPSAPQDLLGMCDFALERGLDGWGFFSIMYGFTYSNSLWDEVNSYMRDQCVSIYPGASCQAISTRNAEAVRESVRRFRAAKARQMVATGEPCQVGEGVFAAMDADGTLIVTGSGQMSDFADAEGVPWDPGAVTHVLVEDGVKLGANSLVSLPGNVVVEAAQTIDSMRVAYGSPPESLAGTISPAEFEKVEVADGKAHLRVSVATNGDLAELTDNWHLARVENARIEDDGTVTLTVPATAENGFMVLRSGRR